MNEQKDSFDQFGEFLVFLAEKNALNEYLEATLKELGSVEMVDYMLDNIDSKYLLTNSFTWDDSPQGEEFWCDIDDEWYERFKPEKEGFVYVEPNKEPNALDTFNTFFEENPDFEPDSMLLDDGCENCLCGQTETFTATKSTLMERIKGFFKL